MHCQETGEVPVSDGQAQWLLVMWWWWGRGGGARQIIKEKRDSRTAHHPQSHIYIQPRGQAVALWRVRLSGEVTLELDKAYVRWVQPLAVQQTPGEGVLELDKAYVQWVQPLAVQKSPGEGVLELDTSYAHWPTRQDYSASWLTLNHHALPYT